MLEGDGLEGNNQLHGKEEKGFALGTTLGKEELEEREGGVTSSRATSDSSRPKSMALKPT